jgi:molybdate transport system substrate-binding protein
MKKTAGLLLSFVAAAVLFGSVLTETAHAAGKNMIQVSAAISLKDALAVLKEIYEKKKPDVAIRFNLASSGMLQKQIEEGAPVDLFISAGKKQMDELAAKKLIVPETRSDLLGNELVLIISKEKKGAIKSFADLADKAQSISIGQPETVPAGKYGKETLSNLKLWAAVEKKIMFAKDVRQVLSYVDSGNVDAGLVYQSDTLAMKSGVVAAMAPKGSHSPILYPMALIKDGKNKAAAGKFMEFLKSAEAAKVFAKYKFIPVTGKQ